MRRALIALAFAVMMAGEAVAGPYEVGQAAFIRGDYATALRLWLPLARRDIVAAQARVAMNAGSSSSARLRIRGTVNIRQV
jgi:hypothetical protein